MTEPKPSEQYKVHQAEAPPRAVNLRVSDDWARAFTRLQQLANEDCRTIHLRRDEDGRVYLDRAS